MRRWLLLVVALLVVGCGKNRPAEGIWPARVAGEEAFTDDQWTKILSAIDYMNTGAKKTIIDVNAPDDHYPIYFRLVPPNADSTRRAGLAIVESDKCTIEITDVVYTASRENVLIPVVDHELGHCAGLEHDSHAGEIMFRTTEELNTYTPEALSRFFQSVLVNTGI